MRVDVPTLSPIPHPSPFALRDQHHSIRLALGIPKIYWFMGVSLMGARLSPLEIFDGTVSPPLQ
jgi:hypothetical protein